MTCDISTCFLFLNLLLLFLKAEEAARESRQMKQDHYAEMRRKKDEEREAQERLLVGHDCFACNTVLASKFRFSVFFLVVPRQVPLFFDWRCGNLQNCDYRKKKLGLEEPRRRKLLHWNLKSGKGSFLLMLKVQLRMKFKMGARACYLIL